MVHAKRGARFRLVVAFAALILVMAGCSSSGDDVSSDEGSETPATDDGTAGTGEEEPTTDEPLRVVLVINGNLGDKSFFDSAQRGMDMVEAEFGAEVRTVELGSDPAAWEPGLADVAADEDSYDVLVTSTFNMAEPLQTVAPDHPDKRFIIFDVAVDYENCDCGNVYSIVYKQNEAAYLGGVYAGLMTQETSIEGMNEDLVVGFLGGIDIPVINDFAIGYQQGAESVGDVEVLVQYAGDFGDPARGKEIALALYSQDADILFHASGGTGQGMFEAAEEQGAWSMGVDSDQAASLADSSPGQAATVLTSVLKNVDASLVRAIGLHIDGSLGYGSLEALGIAEGGVGLARNDQFAGITPDEVISALDEAEAGIASGGIVVESAFG